MSTAAEPGPVSAFSNEAGAGEPDELDIPAFFATGSLNGGAEVGLRSHEWARADWVPGYMV